MKTIVTFGELMLRLKSPSHERLFQSPILETSFGGSEANVAVSLSLLGKKVSYVSALPSNPIGDAALNELSRFRIDLSCVKRTKGRMGIYFLETGSNQRPSTVVYDREGSAISLVSKGDFDWKAIFAHSNWFHISGITPALSESVKDAALEALREAKNLGLTVSIDLNYRKKLWNYGKDVTSVMREFVKYADVLIANEEDIQACLGLELNPKVQGVSGINLNEYQDLALRVKKDFPNISYVAISLRDSFSADRNLWSGVLLSPRGFYEARKYDISDIVDRVGAGDAFAAALIYGLIEFKEDDKNIIEFATAAACLKHTIPGDFNLVKKEEIDALMLGFSSGRVQR